MRPIGGYFELELPSANPTPCPHEGVWVNSGRNALEYILRSIGLERISCLYVPYYTCEAVLQPINLLGIKHKFYNVDQQLRIFDLPVLKGGEYIIVNNYFGILDQYIASLSQIYGAKIIVDNSQALMTPVNHGQMTFYSPRKFIGIPDGGIAYSPNGIEIDAQDSDMDSVSRSSHLLQRLYCGPQKGYADFKENSRKLCSLPLRRMSVLTETMINSLDYKKIVEIRKSNYDTLRNALESHNLLSTPQSDEISCPMVYPFLTNDRTLKSRLIQNQVFIATYWPNVLDWCAPHSIEAQLANLCLPLPIDQRYNADDMNRIIKIIHFV